MNESLLQYELEWIDNNIDRYSSPEHAQAVKKAITLRYYKNHVNKLVSTFLNNGTTKNMFALEQLL